MNRILWHKEVTEFMNELIRQERQEDVKCYPLDALLKNVTAPGQRSKTRNYKITLEVNDEVGAKLMEFAKNLCGMSNSEAGWLVAGLYLMPAKDDWKAL